MILRNFEIILLTPQIEVSSTTLPFTWPNRGSSLSGRCSVEDFFLEHADVGEVAVGARVVEPVADDELVGHLEAQVLHVELHTPPGRLAEEGTDLQGRRLASHKRAHEVRERK